jgi:hypothetical protein
LLLLYGVKAWLCGSIARVNHPNRPFKLFRAGFGHAHGLLSCVSRLAGYSPWLPSSLALQNQYDGRF